MSLPRESKQAFSPSSSPTEVLVTRIVQDVEGGINQRCPEIFRSTFKTELGFQGFFFFLSHLCSLVVGLKVEYLHCSKLSISKSRLQIEIIYRTFQTYEMCALHHTPSSRGPLGNGFMQRDVGSPPCDSAM